MIVVNFNSTDLLRDCLRAVFASRTSADLEVIVVDNASDGFPLRQLGVEFPNVQWLPQSVNTTCTGGNNIGLQAATGELVLMLNPDTRVEPRAIERAVRHLAESPDLVAVGAHLLDEQGLLDRRYYRRLPGFSDVPVLLFEPLFRATSKGRRFLMSDHAFKGQTHVEHAAGVFLLIRRDALAGWLLEPGYFNLLSDVGLSRHLGAIGHVAVFDDVRVHHVGGGGGMVTKDVAKQLLYHHDFTWGLRRYFRGRLTVRQRLVFELALAMYWIARVGRIVASTPRHAPDALRTARAALAGQPPHY